MNIADLGTLLRIYDKLSFRCQHHLVGHLLQCTPATVKLLQTDYGHDVDLKEFFEKMHEFGIHPPTFVPTAALPDDTQAYLVQPPAWKRAGIAAVETSKPCLYTQLKSCVELHPGIPDLWCGYCSGLLTAQNK